MFLSLFLVGERQEALLSQGVAPLVGYCYGGNEKKRMLGIMKYTILYGILMGSVFTAVFILLGKQIAAMFLQENALIE